ncbi:MAG: cytidine deaminase [Streptosporangiales bacterium]
MAVDEELVRAAIEQMNRRWATIPDGGAAALRLADGRILTSVALDNINAGVTLCHEAGAMCQAYTLDIPVVASVCVGRESGDRGFVVLAPCGICQERLALWGPDVEVGVADRGAANGWSSRTLREVHPNYWVQAITADGTWPSYAEHMDQDDHGM